MERLHSTADADKEVAGTEFIEYSPLLDDKHYVQVMVKSEPYYYYGGGFYKVIPGQYEVVSAVVSSLPDGTNTVATGAGTPMPPGRSDGA